MDLESPIMKHQDAPGVFSIIRFRWEQERNNAASESVGRPIYDKVLKVYVSSPGIKTQEVVQEVERHIWQGDDTAPRIRVREEIKARYGEQLKAWEAGSAEAMTGTPLSELKTLDVAWIASLREMGIHTIEALAGLQDGALFMGARPLREQARAYLEQAKGQEPMARLIAENEQMRAQIEELTATVKALAEVSDDEPKRGPGRPRRDAA